MEEAYDIRQGDCREVMSEMPDNSVDAIVTDPPYGLSFMGKEWDHGVPGIEFWTEALRVAKPGAHLLAFGGTRTFHRLTCAIEDAGWEIRDCVMWVYGSGFPKSLDVSKAIDKAAGAEREVVGPNRFAGLNGKRNTNCYGVASRPNETAPATDAARQWAGWGTALKPAWEPVIVARKPLIGTVAENVLRHGTGGINVDGCRVGTDEWRRSASGDIPSGKTGIYRTRERVEQKGTGRWPANVIHDGSEEPTGLLGDAARFFYCPKASKTDREEGGDGMAQKTLQAYGDFAGTAEHSPKQNVKARNHHPTVKPTALMRYLCRLVTPPGGVVLDPFMGSGSTGKAAILEGFRFIGIDLNPEYIEIARGRIAQAARESVTLF